jgi:hypothetical protein
VRTLEIVYRTSRGFSLILVEPEWAERMTDEDRRALTPLFWTHVNPYVTFRLDMDSRLDLAPTGPTDKATSEEYPSKSAI